MPETNLTRDKNHDTGLLLLGLILSCQLYTNYTVPALLQTDFMIDQSWDTLIREIDNWRPNEMWHFWIRNKTHCTHAQTTPTHVGASVVSDVSALLHDMSTKADSMIMRQRLTMTRCNFSGDRSRPAVSRDNPSRDRHVHTGHCK